MLGSSDELDGAEQHEGAGQSVVGNEYGTLVINAGEIDLNGSDRKQSR